MISVGITGQSGFIGTHLYNYLGLKKGEIERIPFRDEFFLAGESLKNFVEKCDVIVHLAALNRHNDPEVIYRTNIELVNKLITTTEETDRYPNIIFSSSTQEQGDNPYGRSKLQGRKLFEEWSRRHEAKFVGLVIPNVFGPFGNPHYNSVVATFSHQLTHDETPTIQDDNNLRMMYINELAQYMYKIIKEGVSSSPILVPFSVEIKVSELLTKLNYYKELYLEQNIIPSLNNEFEVSLFNTFRCFIDHSHYPFYLEVKNDNRGFLAENIKEHTGGQSFFSITRPGITRGNHFHTRKIERFCVIRGKASIRLRRIGTSDVVEYLVDGQKPSTVDMPIWHTHSITNIGDSELLTLFWSNEIYDPDDPDTYFEEV